MPETGQEDKATGAGLAALLALAAGAFALGFAEFAMMGVLPDVAADLGVSIPYAGNYISVYAVGVCFGTLFLVFGRNARPKALLLLFAGLMCAGNALAALAGGSQAMLAARFVSGLPHGAYFGTATLVAKRLARPGREARAVAVMVLGQTAANMVGVPFGTWLAGVVSWRAAFAFCAAWAVASGVALARAVPNIPAIERTTLSGQFAFLRKPGPWLVLIAVAVGNAGQFCWWSYVSPWLLYVGGFAAQALPLLLMLAGAGMVAGNLAGGRVADATTPARMAAAGHALCAVCLALIFLARGQVPCGVLLVACSFAMFSMSSSQQLLMVRVGAGGGEMTAGACVQVAYNLANAVGAWVGQAVLNTGAGYECPALAGAPFALCAVCLLLVFASRFESEHETA